jgi:hypothetical protein
MSPFLSCPAGVGSRGSRTAPSHAVRMVLLAVVEQIRCKRMQRHRTEAKGKTINRSTSCQPLPILLYLARLGPEHGHVAQSENILEEWQRMSNKYGMYHNITVMCDKDSSREGMSSFPVIALADFCSCSETLIYDTV